MLTIDLKPTEYFTDISNAVYYAKSQFTGIPAKTSETVEMIRDVVMIFVNGPALLCTIFREFHEEKVRYFVSFNCDPILPRKQAAIPVAEAENKKPLKGIQGKALDFLERHPGEWFYSNIVADKLALNNSERHGVGYALTNLFKAGLVKREYRNDRKVYFVDK